MKYKFNQTMFVLVIILIFVVSLSINASITSNVAPTKVTKSNFMLDTYVTITLYDYNNKFTNNELNEILDGAFNEIVYYENMFSRTIETSDISKINNAKGEPVIVSDETIEQLLIAMYYCDMVSGDLDITVGAISSIWDFNNKYLPTPDEINNLINTIDYKNISITDNTVSLTNSLTMLDLGATGKGYIADKIKEYLISENIDSAIINLGGNVLCVGDKNNESFKVGIANPFDANTTYTTLDIKDKSVVTSGSYQRFFEKDEIIYSHILDTTTGYPAVTDIKSVSIISNESVVGDCLSTSIYILGSQKGLELIEKLDNIECVIITDDGNLIKSSGLVL